MDISFQPTISAVKRAEHFFDDDCVDIVDNRTTASLFRHAMLPPHIRSDIMSKIHNVSLVISHCDHPLTWIMNLTSIYGSIINKVWVFTKCGQEVIDAPQGAEVVELPNVGRCDHSYAHWLNHHFYYEMNPQPSTHDVIVFMKDTDYMLDKEYTDGRSFEDLLTLAVTNGLGCMMRIDVVQSNLHKYSMLRKMDFSNKNHTHHRSDGKDFGEKVPFHNDNIQNLGEWIDQLNLHPAALNQDIVPVCYGGVFAATRYQVAVQPKRVWKAIEDSLSRGDNIAEGHFAERMWAALLSKPYCNESADAIWSMSPTVRENPNFYRGILTLSGDVFWWS
jgi:hypothetical protein